MDIENVTGTGNRCCPLQKSIYEFESAACHRCHWIGVRRCPRSFKRLQFHHHIRQSAIREKMGPHAYSNPIHFIFTSSPRAVVRWRSLGDVRGFIPNLFFIDRYPIPTFRNFISPEILRCGKEGLGDTGCHCEATMERVITGASVTGGDLCSVSPRELVSFKSPRSDYVTFLAPFTRRNQSPLAAAAAEASAEASFRT